MIALGGSAPTAQIRRRATALLLLGPSLALLGAVLFFPLGMAVWSSFFKIDILNIANRSFVGLQNYATILSSGWFHHSFVVTIIYTAVTVAGSYVIGLVFALALRRGFRGRALARTLAILPWAVPQVAAVLVWAWMLDPNYGVVNYLLLELGLLSEPVGWLQSPIGALAAVSLVTIWCTFPFACLMLLAQLETIPGTLYEAAAVDGASSWQGFRYITLPALRFINAVLVLLLTLISFTRTITIIYVMTAGGPSNATSTLPIETYLRAFKYFDLGIASALGTIVLIVAVAFSGVYLLAFNRSN